MFLIFDIDRVPLVLMSKNSSVGGVDALTLLFSAMGYFVYNGLDGALAIFILCILFGFAILISFIPVIGVILQYLIMAIIIFPWVQSFTGISETLLTTVIFAFNMCIGLICCAITTLWLYLEFSDN